MEQRLSAALERLAFGLRVTVGGDHDDRHGRTRHLCLGEKIKPAHPRHVDVGQDKDKRSVTSSGNAFQSGRGRLRKFHRETAGTQVAPELLAEKLLHVRFVVDH